MANLPQLKICKNHKAIHFFSSRTGRNFDWDFVVDDLIKSVSVRGRVSVNDGDAYIDLALQGFGIIQGPRYMLTNHLESGLLKRYCLSGRQRRCRFQQFIFKIVIYRLK